MNTILDEFKWDVRFMRIAREISTWSKDPSTQIGAVIVNSDRRILATGYNGFPRGVADTPDLLNDREEKYKRIIHGEMNALLNALYNGVSLKDSTIYIWGLPVCSDCAKSIIQSGIKNIVITDPDDKPERWQEHWHSVSLPMIREAGLYVTVLENDAI